MAQIKTNRTHRFNRTVTYPGGISVAFDDKGTAQVDDEAVQKLIAIDSSISSDDVQQADVQTESEAAGDHEDVKSKLSQLTVAELKEIVESIDALKERSTHSLKKDELIDLIAPHVADDGI